ncbi:CD63 antigen [Eumeta japonica]|uniref:CD63 antigen n=1 Tax=Eumeta variegata TaxID=151549 RepID=A0A4C1UIB1_EUMVA|nr:CD63 antigen [Eumeta japonica]
MSPSKYTDTTPILQFPNFNTVAVTFSGLILFDDYVTAQNYSFDGSSSWSRHLNDSASCMPLQLANIPNTGFLDKNNHYFSPFNFNKQLSRSEFASLQIDLNKPQGYAVTGLIVIIVGAKAMLDAGPYIDYTGENFYSAGPVVLIIIGIIIFVVSFFGCFGAIKENRCMILTFATLLVIIFAAEFAVGIAGYVKHKDLETSITNHLNTTMKNANTTEALRPFNILQTDLQCCGIKGYEDWINNGKPIPWSCCGNSNGTDCSKDDKNMHKQGCLDALVDLFKHIAAYLGGVGIGIAVVQVLILILMYNTERWVDDRRKMQVEAMRCSELSSLAAYNVPLDQNMKLFNPDQKVNSMRHPHL